MQFSHSKANSQDIFQDVSGTRYVSVCQSREWSLDGIRAGKIILLVLMILMKPQEKKRIDFLFN